MKRRARSNRDSLVGKRLSKVCIVFIAIPLAAWPLQLDTKRLSVDGIVKDTVTGHPLRKAFVRLSSASHTELTFWTATDENGIFRFANLEPMSYHLEVEHAGYINTGDSTNPTDLLVGGQNITNLVVGLVPQSSIAGRVVDDDGDGWPHAEVNVFRAVWKKGRRQIEGYSGSDVNDEGGFRVGGLPPGRYYFSAEPDAAWERHNRGSGELLQPTWYPSSVDLTSATAIDLAPGDKLTGLELRLRKASMHRIRGTVVGLSSVPAISEQGIWGAIRIYASLDSGIAVNGYVASVASNGTFEITGVPPGTYDIKAMQGAQPAFGIGHVKVTVANQDIDDVSLQLHAPIQVNGSLLLDNEGPRPLANASILLEPLDDTVGLKPVVSRKDGAFEFPQVPQEQFHVRVQNVPIDNWYIKTIKYGGRDSKSGVITISSAVGKLEIVLGSHAGRLVGTVKGEGTENGPKESQSASATWRSSSSIVVVLIPDTDDSFEREFGSMRAAWEEPATFLLKNIAPGQYRLFAFQTIPEGLWTDTQFMKAVSDMGKRIDLQDGDAQVVEIPMISSDSLHAILSRLGLE